MSADRYSECPKCSFQKKARADTRALYGTIPLEEYEERIKNILEDKEEMPTMREDWEIYHEDGKLIFSYAAGCECGFRFVIKKEFKML